MSVSSEVRRTLVKSPPELWAELSDPATLGRHLGELGEIRILRTDPERSVDWEAAGADGTAVSGRVEIQPSGWGTRVTLSANRTVLESPPEPEAAPEPQSMSEPELAEPEPESAAEMLDVPPESGSEPEPQTGELESRRGFFARLFRRRRSAPQTEPDVLDEPGPELSADPQLEPSADPQLEAESVADPEQPGAIEIDEPAPQQIAPLPEEPARVEEPIPEPDISAELVELEEQTTAVLTGVLDRLGAAHHRPFSRS